ncbi:MAG: hypothetical protein MJZ03_01270 [archaeon]|nr:hypothetical protein [archaeon]
MEDELIINKASLIASGAVLIPKNYRVPVEISRSTAGPEAGQRSLVFSFGRMRVKKSISTNNGDFVYCPEKKTLVFGNIVIHDVTIMPVAYHCPEQAFFNIDQNCMFECAYCSSPLLPNHITKKLDAIKIVNLIHQKEELIHSVAITSGVNNSVNSTVDRITECIRHIRNEFPNMPIGVESYIDDTTQVDKLKTAGANEIKINIETATERLDICPNIDRTIVFGMLAYAVNVFGKGKVTSNIIIGLGETNSELEDIINKLCSMGVAPYIRSLRISPFVKDKLHQMNITNVPSSERMIHVAKIQKMIMERHNLDTHTFCTMCFRCGCCDLIPFKDF